MGTIKYSDLIKDVLPYLTADPSDPFTESAIKQTVIEFCSKSLVWKHIADAVDVDANESVYDIDIPNGASVTMVIDVLLNGIPLEAKQPEWLNNNMPLWRTVAATPKHYTQTEPDQIILAPLPNETKREALTITAALQPSRSAAGFPEWIHSKFPNAIADGATARLMLIPGKPWSDAKNGAYRQTRFESAIANARAMGATGLGRSPIRTASYH